jgi:hypothetical protein
VLPDLAKIFTLGYFWKPKAIKKGHKWKYFHLGLLFNFRTFKLSFDVLAFPAWQQFGQLFQTIWQFLFHLLVTLTPTSLLRCLSGKIS